jgi:NAD(P)-dependent dehydrogenase (short-subunit alcohol dehydrogenase family)
MKKCWLITGTARGLGLEIAKAAPRAGDCVVATGRRREAVTDGLGQIMIGYYPSNWMSGMPLRRGSPRR